MKQSRPKKVKARSSRGVLLILAVLLIGSGLLRAGLGAGEAMATQREADQANPQDALACEVPEDLASVLEAFQAREQRIATREQQIAERLKALDLADREVSEKLTGLAEVEERLRGTLALADTASEDDIAQLVSVYEAMKPKDAALLFEEMRPDFAAGFLGRMRPEAAAGILAGLTPQTAYSLSVILAGRNASVPKN
ncbi:MAG: MotE family protein [Paracoccaceae bacterium]|jgi:flagellar motility protein MotE (MotC chaperone)